MRSRRRGGADALSTAARAAEAQRSDIFAQSATRRRSAAQRSCAEAQRCTEAQQRRTQRRSRAEAQARGGANLRCCKGADPDMPVVAEAQ